MLEAIAIQSWILAPEPESRRKMPWRKIHLDFHNSNHIDSVGEEFDSGQFIRTLQDARVDSIVVFAKDMHGYCYYPSEVGPVHPGLKRDLLGEQVAACGAAGIEVYAYYCTLWDHYLAHRHPNWLSIQRNGDSYLPKKGDPPEWTALCASNSDLIDLQERHVWEILSTYDVDGIWFDMPIPRDGECFCPSCSAAIPDPNDTPSQRRHQQQLHRTFLRRMYETAQAVRPGCQVDFNNQPAFGLGERIEWMDSIDIEALPTAQWGYDFFPTVARYVRTFPRTMYGMTGRFLKSWGDFGGLKSGHQLTSECFGIVSLGAKCDIGDQMPPSGRLDPAVYRAISHAYDEIERLEPHLEGARAVSEAVVVVNGLPLDSLATPSTAGLVKALAELSIQFDVMESSQDWHKYPLAIFADDQDLYHPKSLRMGTNLPGSQASKFNPSYAVVPGEYEFAIYGESCSWMSQGQALATLGEPPFNRAGDHYTSHAQAPITRFTDRAVAEVRGQQGFIGFDLGRLYAETGYGFYRDVLGRVVHELLPEPLVQTSHPGIIQATVMWNLASGDWLVHVFDTSISRPSPGHPAFYELAPPRADVEVTLNIGGIELVRAVRANQDLTSDGYRVSIPRLDRYELLVIRAKDKNE